MLNLIFLLRDNHIVNYLEALNIRFKSPKLQSFRLIKSNNKELKQGHRI